MYPLITRFAFCFVLYSYLKYKIGKLDVTAKGGGLDPLKLLNAPPLSLE